MYNEKLTQIIADTVKNTLFPYSMTLELAKKVAVRVEKKAEETGVNAVIAIADAAARPVLTECMDNAYIASYDIAFNKAYTSAALKIPTKILKTLAQPGGELYGIQHTNDGKIVVFGGGVPLEYNGNIIGALGVSGGSERQDTMLADFGAEIFTEELLCLKK